MKAISLWQPWASLIAMGQKRIETRSWWTRYRGPLAIHAAKPLDGFLLLDALDALLAKGIDIEHMNLPRGAIIATAELIDCVRVPDGDHVEACDGIIIPPHDMEHHFGNYAPGRFALVLRNVNPLQVPIPQRGSLGLFEVPDVC